MRSKIKEMQDLKQKTLALFFTYGVSLKIWDEVGILDREIKPYIKLSDYFDQIYFFTYGDKTDLEYQKLLPSNIKIFPKKWNIFSMLYSVLLPFFYRKELKNTDILKTNQMSGAWAAVLTKWLYKKNLIVRCGYEWLSFVQKQNSAWWKKQLTYFIEKITYKTADKIILTSKEGKAFITDKLGVDKEKIRIIPNYIDTNLFTPLLLEKEKGRAILVSRLAKEKNLFNLIEAVKDLPIKLVVFGKGPLEKRVKGFSKEKRVQVEFRGVIPNKELSKEFNKSEIFILPSLHEGCPKALLEAMACGLPCIGTNVQGIREIIKHKQNGYLCETGILSIKKAILEVLSNKILQEKIGQSARKTILANFSLGKILEKEIAVYMIL